MALFEPVPCERGRTAHSERSLIVQRVTCCLQLPKPLLGSYMQSLHLALIAALRLIQGYFILWDVFIARMLCTEITLDLLDCQVISTVYVPTAAFGLRVYL